jgi:hypothetical protein
VIDQVENSAFHHRSPQSTRRLNTNHFGAYHQVENSSFTGEAEPVELCLEKTDDEARHSKNLAFNSAMIVEGSGACVGWSPGVQKGM